MTKIRTIAYFALGALIIPSYYYVYHLLTLQEAEGKVVISNMTANLVILFMMVGGSSPLLLKRFFPRVPQKYSIIVTLGLMFILLQVLKLCGYELRF